MKLISRLLGKKVTDPTKVEGMGIAKKLDTILNQLPIDLFSRYKDVLLKESKSYVVPAVWGMDKNQNLSEDQKIMHSEISPKIEKAISEFGTDGLTPEQVFAVRYLICGIVVFKIEFMIERAKRLGMGESDPIENTLADMSPMGNA